MISNRNRLSCTSTLEFEQSFGSLADWRTHPSLFFRVSARSSAKYIVAAKAFEAIHSRAGKHNPRVGDYTGTITTPRAASVTHTSRPGGSGRESERSITNSAPSDVSTVYSRCLPR